MLIKKKKIFFLFFLIHAAGDETQLQTHQSGCGLIMINQDYLIIIEFEFLSVTTNNI